MADKQFPTSDTSASRRAFFRRILLRGLNEAQRTGQRLGGRVAAAIGPAAAAGPASPPPVSVDAASAREPLRILRPPGAAPGEAFADLCSRCGDCVRACPAQCIELEAAPDASTPGAGGLGGGLPYIVARQSPCVVCDDLACMTACPTGALQRVASPGAIAMGKAVVDGQRCLRRPATSQPVGGVSRGLNEQAVVGEDCRLCVRDCPMGEAALGFDARGQIQVRDGCVGCGVCERVCPTEPASIVVLPADHG